MVLLLMEGERQCKTTTYFYATWVPSHSEVVITGKVDHPAESDYDVMHGLISQCPLNAMLGWHEGFVKLNKRPYQSGYSSR